MNVFKERQLWIPMLVRNAVVLALRVDRALPARIGPAGDRAFWPDSSGDEAVEDDRFRPTRDDITHAEYVLLGYKTSSGAPRPAWLNGSILGYPEQRETFRRWATWASFGKVDQSGNSQTDEDFARHLRISEATLWRRNDIACRIIAQGLNEAELPVWYVEKPKRKKNMHLIESVN